MADFRRIILYFALALICFLLWKAWEDDQKIKPAISASQHQLPTTPDKESASGKEVANSIVPVDVVNEVNKTDSNSVGHLIHKIPAERLLHVKTDVLDVLIDKKGGSVVKLSLLKYPVALKAPTPITLFDALTKEGNKHYSISHSGIISSMGPDTQTESALYEAEKAAYELAPDQNELIVKMRWKNASGLHVEKNIIFERGKYSVKFKDHVENKTSSNWSGNFYAQIKQRESESESSALALSTFTGASVSTDKKHYEKITFKKMSKENLDETTRGGWLSFQKRYFLAAWIPEPKQVNRYYSRADSGDKIYTVGVVSPSISLKPGESKEIQATLYAGPEVAKDLKKLAPYLDLTVDYGWLWFIGGPIFWVMEQLYKLVGNWGLAIILVTVLIKLAFYHLSATSYRSMAKMQKLTPMMQKIREQYKDDKQRMSQETMALYRREKANPLSGCLPMLIQIPFFFALYQVLIESVELRQAPFIFWIQDLSAKDPFYVLPILMGLSMFVQQRLNPAPADPMQAKVMMLMPVMFTVLFLNFPSGLVLYWLTNNCLSILQQWWIMRSVAKKDSSKK